MNTDQLCPIVIIRVKTISPALWNFKSAKEPWELAVGKYRKESRGGMDDVKLVMEK